ncbi:MAG: 6-hydroxymethylpterin diphosphokinase MptE-like protein [Halococcoides sp.]
MDPETWLPVYESIRADFGYDRAADRAARDRLADLAAGADPQAALLLLDGRVAIVGPAGDPVEECRAVGPDRIVVVSSATQSLLAADIPIDLVVTDLDGTPEAVVKAADGGVPVAVHAHGDNRDAIDRWVPQIPIDRLVPTTQVEPRDPVLNPGGFTDGDRAAFLADHAGADRLRFPGWDLDPAFETAATDLKARKLRWAARLLAWLERRRDERFSILDDRRDALDRPEPLG